LDKHGKTIEAAVSASRSQFANVEQQVRELGDKHERVAKQVSLVQNSAASTVQADAIRQKVERLAAAVDSLDTKLASGTRRVEFFALAAFLIVNLALLLYMLRTLREMNRYNKIA
jgi:flagellar biosynthesis chaperone FliJ